MEIFETGVLFIIVFTIFCLCFHLEKLFDLKMVVRIEVEIGNIIRKESRMSKMVWIIM